MPIDQEKAIGMIFDGAQLLADNSWFLRLAPPGNEHHRRADIEKMAANIAQVQSGLAALRRSINRAARPKRNKILS